MPLLSLSNELLSYCFVFLEPSKSNIGNLRLVSKRIHANASPFLITNIHVSLEHESIRELTALSEHPVFSRCIKSVELDVSYYDKVLVESLARFAEHNASDMGNTLDLMERWTSNWYASDGKALKGHQEERDAYSGAYDVLQEWDDLVIQLGENYQVDITDCGATDGQKLLLDAYQEYVKLYEEQTEFLTDGKGIGQIAQALTNITGLQEILLVDEKWTKPDESVSTWDWMVNGLKQRCLAKSRWNGSFMTAMDTQPPTHVISDLFLALANSQIRPKLFAISITAPANMRCISFTPTELEAIRVVLGQADDLGLSVVHRARRGSLAENNDRSNEELAGLCALTRAFFSSPRLSRMALSLGEYPCFYEIPTISFSDLIQAPLTSSRISKAKLQGVPFKFTELQEFVDKTKSMLETFELTTPYLLNAKWLDGVDVLRQLNNLAKFDFKYPKGGEYGDGKSNRPDIDGSAIERYILREIEVSPLQGWTAHDRNEISGR